MDLRTPDEWCSVWGYQIMDPDGWRGTGAPPWDEPISEDEFLHRAAQCTMKITK